MHACPRTATLAHAAVSVTAWDHGQISMLAYRGMHIACYASSSAASAAAAFPAAAELLTLVLLMPGREWSLTELADKTSASLSSAEREMARAEDACVVSTHRLGNTRLVTAADSPITGPLTELLLRSFRPRQVIAEQLAGLPGIETAFLFGSWAARYAGRPGRAPADIDVLVIGHPDRDQLDDAAQRAGSRLAREVNVTVRSPQWWRGGGDGFHTEVTARPLIPVLPDGGQQ
jgi:hypothetical protein